MQYLAMRGPKPGQIADFWKAILEQRCKVVVMLTKLMENGKVREESLMYSLLNFSL